MEELVRISLDNEMDLILAHKRAMKLVELVGLSLAAQTTFATAVSEVARYAIEQGTGPLLTLCTDRSRGHQYLVAIIEDKNLPVANPLNQSLLYAQRLVEKMEITNTGKGGKIILYYSLPTSRKLSGEQIDQWRAQFDANQPLSAYDEIKRKNEQLQELALRLQASEQHYQRVTNSLPLLIFTANQAGQLLYANTWLTDLTGHSLQSINQTKWAKIIHPDDYDDFWALWAKQAANYLPFQYECRLRDATTQSYLWHLFTAQPVKSEADKVAAWTGFVVNIDAQKLVEQTIRHNEELAQAKAKLEQSQHELESTVRELNRSNEDLSQFAYIASHDLQEPLRKIQQFGDLLQSRDSDLSGESRTYLSRMQSAASRMSVLIKDLLSFSRLSTRRETPTFVTLTSLVNNCLENLSFVIEETQAQIQVHALPTIEGEASQLGQLFQNLLSNALKFHRAGIPPHIYIKSEEITADQLPHAVKPARQSAVYHKIEISDNGIGFDEKYLDRIFQVFQRLHGKNEFAGTGVGLAICQKVATNHGGAITAISQLGEGATFQVYLPVASTIN
ncbi:PAS domain S-box protein [Spirosoma sp. KCTC 42546]|uniref:sensor histidine kinase n=1 Tax=Spirosoma sp. KCTC 42546 TaxID=2520506 RepID=UPI001157F41C|nr:ATP-binding protein [Spirosoma sp. KCTC 42546]QDK82092.1 PAS domain S-box protein [Spirosoma sp. KCTC 42546]